MRISKLLALGLALAAGCLVFTPWTTWLGAESSPASDHPPLQLQVDDTPLAREAGGRVVSYADMLEKVQPAVVSVSTARIVRVMRSNPSNPMEDLLRRFYGLPPSSRRGVEPDDIEERKLPSGLGSGVIISADGYILTNNHVVTGESEEVADEILVRLHDGRETPAKVIGRDPRTDVALLKVEETGLPSLALADSELLRVGDVVFAIGNPLGVGQTVTMGIVSATGRSDLGLLGAEGYENFIQTDASINPGNSGGALIDAQGRLVGINTAIISRTGGNIGIGFAVPINMARNVAQSLIDSGEVQRGFLGVNIATLTADLAEAFGVNSAKGVLIEGVQAGTPAEQAGLKRGDVIVAVNGQPVDSVSSLRLRIAQTPPGGSLALRTFRGGEERDVTVTLASLDGPAGPNATVLEGVTLAPVNDQSREEFGLAEDVRGLVVTELRRDSPYRSVLRPGMVILEINDRAVADAAAARQALRPGVNKLWVSYRGNQGFVALRVR